MIIISGAPCVSIGRLFCASAKVMRVYWLKSRNSKAKLPASKWRGEDMESVEDFVPVFPDGFVTETADVGGDGFGGTRVGDFELFEGVGG